MRTVKAKGLLGILLSLAITVMTAAVFTVSAGAESIYDTAKAIKSGSSYSTQLYQNGDIADYKITATRSGTLSIKLTSQMYALDVYLFDSDGNKVALAEGNNTSGNSYWRSDSYYYLTECYWNDTVERYVGALNYGIQKGTYYIRFMRDTRYGNGKLSFTATYPSSSSSTAKISYLSFSMKKGTTAQFGAVLSESSDTTVTWSTSDSSVATVSSTGKITAKAKGTAIISAKLGTSTVKLKIKVTA